MSELYKDEYCDYELSVRLKNIGYDKISDKVYSERTQIHRYIKLRYPGLTEDEYYKLTVDGGGTLDYKDVFVKSQLLIDYEYRDCGYVLAPRLLTVVQWLEQKYHMRLSLESVDGNYYKTKLIREDVEWNIQYKPYYLYSALNFFIKQAVEIIEKDLQNKK